MAKFRITLDVEASSLTGAWDRASKGFPKDFQPGSDWSGISRFHIEEVVREIEMDIEKKESA